MEHFRVDFMCVGAARSGTTWLYECLSEHPRICMSKPKELHFFSTRTIFTTSNTSLGMSWYRSKFSHWNTGQLRGEASPSYLVDEDAAARISTAFPNCKLIFLFRNPLKALHSLYIHGSCCYQLGESFEDFIANDRFVRMYEYDRWVKNYLRHFPCKQLLFLQFTDIVKSPKAVLDRICTFLDIETITPSCLYKKINPNQTCKLHWLKYLLEKTKETLDAHPTTQLLYKKTGLQDLGIALARANRKQLAQKPAINAVTKERLAKHYLRHNQALKKLTGISVD